jgi:hypothetical protein
MKAAAIVFLVTAFAGCAPNTVTLHDQERYLWRQDDLCRSGDLLARKLIAESFLRLTPEERSRFHVRLMDLREPAETGCNMEDMARADVGSGKFNVLIAGDTFISWETEERMWKYISAKYGIEHFAFHHGGTEPSQFHELIAKYDYVVEQAIDRKFHKSHHAIWAEAKRHVEEIDKQGTLPD